MYLQWNNTGVTKNLIQLIQVWSYSLYIFIACDIGQEIHKGKLLVNEHSLEDKASVKCDDGYVPSQPEVKCQASGKWEAATCNRCNVLLQGNLLVKMHHIKSVLQCNMKQSLLLVFMVKKLIHLITTYIDTVSFTGNLFIKRAPLRSKGVKTNFLNSYF
jgi:hypothetical protein